MLTGPGATIGKARKLRKQMSLPEVLLWRELRKRPKGRKFRRQHPAGPYVLDFVCLETRLAIEVDGEAHARGDAPAHEEVRDLWMAEQGFETLRIPARHILSDMEAVMMLIAHHQSSEPPIYRRRQDPA